MRQNFVFRKIILTCSTPHLPILDLKKKKNHDENYRIVELLFWESTVNNIDNALRESKEQG
jgi:hypothetical protein